MRLVDVEIGVFFTNSKVFFHHSEIFRGVVTSVKYSELFLTQVSSSQVKKMNTSAMERESEVNLSLPLFHQSLSS